jgi:hypothetical protein
LLDSPKEIPCLIKSPAHVERDEAGIENEIIFSSPFKAMIESG